MGNPTREIPPPPDENPVENPVDGPTFTEPPTEVVDVIKKSRNAGKRLFTDLTKEIKSVKKEVENLSDELKKVQSVVEELISNPEVSRETNEAGATSGEPKNENEVDTLVRQMLGDGWTHKSEPATSGLSFKFVLIPPDHLKTSPGDIRVKVISNAEGLSGIRQYCEIVKAFSTRWAQQNGVNYQK